MPTYYAKQDGFIDGTHYLVDAEVKMSRTQAKYHLIEGRLGTEPTPKEKPDAPAGKRSAGGSGPEDGKAA